MRVHDDPNLERLQPGRFAADPRQRPWPIRRVRLPIAGLWWLHPARFVALVLIPVYLSFVLYDFSKVEVPSYIPSTEYFWGLCLLVLLAFGAALGSEGAYAELHRPLRRPIDLPDWSLGLLFLLAVVGYVVWFAPAIADPSLLLDIFDGERRNLRDVIETQPGITTLTQCGVVYAIGCAIRPGLSGRPLGRWLRLGVAIMFALATVRAIAWAERLAIVEMVVCWWVARAAFREVAPGRRQALAALPVIAPVIVYFAFMATEYFRTWEFYSAQYDSIFQFTFDRLVAYYATAANNGIGWLIERHDWPVFNGRFVAEWAYSMPGLGPWLIAQFGDARDGYYEFLDYFARREFNNPTGLFTIVYDIGWFGSSVYFFGIGMAIGAAYRSFAGRRVGGLLLYPVCLLFLSELLRFNYFAASRFIPIAGAIVLIGFVARPRTFRRPVEWRTRPIPV